MRKKIERYIADNKLLKERARVVVGLSGGPDSVCLLRVLKALGHEVIAVHCNFHLRGEESMRDEAFATNLCEELGVECVKADFDTEAWANEHKVSIEMAARELRYDLFRKVKEEKGCEAIAVGHHQGDNVETLMLNLVRGTGIQGACAIQPKNGDIVRPLLCVTRDEIESYLKDKGQGYVTDHTNQEDKYSRNKIRLNVMPVLEEINQGAAHNIATSIENLNEVRKVYAHAMKVALAECCKQEQDGGLRIDIKKLAKQISPLSVLHEALSPIGFNREQMKGILRAMGESGKVFKNANGRRLVIDRNEMIVEGEASMSDAEMPKIEMRVVGIEDLDMERNPNFAYLDAEKVKGELKVRCPREGDSFAPFGMGGRRKLVSDYLTDQKLSRLEKEKQPLLCDGDEIAWVVGRRSSELYRVDERTRRVILCRV